MATETAPDMASCECVHALKDHSKRARKPCLICDDCPMFVWSGSYFRPPPASPGAPRNGGKTMKSQEERDAMQAALRTYQEDNRPAGYGASFRAGWAAGLDWQRTQPALARHPVAQDDEVTEAARRLLAEVDLQRSQTEYAADPESLLSFENDISTVARAALVAGAEVARVKEEIRNVYRELGPEIEQLRAALLALSGGGLSAPCWCGRLPHTSECDQAHEALAASGTATVEPAP